jgi:hypothetical protein
MQGIIAALNVRQGGRRHEYLRLQEEKVFLAPFFAQAEKGEIATVVQIQCAFEAKVEHEAGDSTIYRLLNRHGSGSSLFC